MWKNWKPGQKVIYTVDDFDGHGTAEGTVTGVYDDHAIVDVGDMHLWVEDFNVDLFEEREKC